MKNVVHKRGKKVAPRASTGLKVATILVAMALFAGSITLAAHYGILWLRTTQFLSLKEIHIECEDEAIKEWAFDQMAGLMGTNIFSLKKDRLEETLLKNPWIRAVTFHLSPPHGVKIEIETRRAVAFFKGRDSACLVDSNGESFCPQQGIDTSTYLELKGRTDGKARVILGHFIGLVDRYGKILCYKNIASVTIDKGTMEVVTRSNEIPLFFDLSRPLDVQMKRAEAILYHLYSSGKYRYVKAITLWIADDKAIAQFKKKV